MDQSSSNRPFYLPRLPREYYQGDAAVHWTLSVSHRAQGWLSQHFHCGFRELMLHVAAREGLLCPMYCLMPDHLHLIWMGLHAESDQRNGMAFLRTYLEPKLAPHKFQHQAHDHVLREEERRRNAFASVCRYVLENPVRAKLAGHHNEWPFCGAVIPGYPSMSPTQEEFWDKFWRIYGHTKSSDAAKIARPSIP